MAALLPCLCLGLLLGNEDGSEIGYLYPPSFDAEAEPAGPLVPYHPQPGDIFLSMKPAWRAKLTYRMAWTGPPHHSGIVVALPVGGMGVLEAGPGTSIRVAISEPLGDFLPHIHEGGRVWIRRRRTPLTPDQSSQLTRFALAQTGKPFALVRLVGQVTPLRSRGPVRTRWRGQPHGNRPSYFCSELVTEACVAAGLIDAARARPAATYPRDLFFGRSNNPFLDANLEINEAWLPPARWQALEGGTGLQG